MGVDNDCFPYSSEAHEVPDCDSKCENDKTYKVSHFCATTAAEGIKKEIYRNGPVVSALIVYSDFLGYAGGIYKPHATATRFSGAQAVEIMDGAKMLIPTKSSGSSRTVGVRTGEKRDMHVSL